MPNGRNTFAIFLFQNKGQPWKVKKITHAVINKQMKYTASFRNILKNISLFKRNSVNIIIPLKNISLFKRNSESIIIS